MRLLKRFVKWFDADLTGRRLPETRKVLLEMGDGTLLVAVATLTDSGWVARWIPNEDAWSLLLEDGTVKGTSAVRSWLPHTGWATNSAPVSKESVSKSECNEAVERPRFPSLVRLIMCACGKHSPRRFGAQIPVVLHKIDGTTQQWISPGVTTHCHYCGKVLDVDVTEIQ